MADVKNMLLGVLIFGAVVMGFSIGFNDWYSRAAPDRVMTVNYGLSNSSAYLNNWANQSISYIKNSPNDQLGIGTGFVLLQSVYQVLSLVINLPGQVIMPIISFTASTLMLPSWFVSFVMIAALILILIAVVDAIKGYKL